MRRPVAAALALALGACTSAADEDLADGGEVLEAAGICEGDVEAADEGLWRCPTGEPGSFYVLLAPGEDVDVLRTMYLQDGAGGRLVAGDEPEPWLLDTHDPAVADEVARRTGGEVVEGDG